jgi:hypothetical protein
MKTKLPIEPSDPSESSLTFAYRALEAAGYSNTQILYFRAMRRIFDAAGSAQFAFRQSGRQESQT